MAEFQRFICYGVAALGLSVLALTVGPRAISPWPLEWMEGASLQHALRLLDGRPLYAEPSAEFIAFVYPPLAYLPMAASAFVFGPSLVAARLPSLLGLLVSLICVWRIVSRETGKRELGWLAAGIYALGFGYTGGFLDLVRVDAVFMALLWLAAERWSAGAVAVSLSWLALSVLAKQHGLIVLGLVSLGLVLRTRLLHAHAHARALAVVWLGLGGVLVALNGSSGGWLRTYAWEVPSGHGLVVPLLASYFAVDVLVYLPVLALCASLALRRGLISHSWGFWLLAALLASALGRAHPGGDDNVRLPGFAFLALLGCLGFGQLVLSASTQRVRLAWSAAIALQAALLLQLPAAYWPSRDQAADFGALRLALEQCAAPAADGGTVALDHAGLTGRPFFHTMALSDLRSAGDAALAARATAAVVAALNGPQAPAALAVSAAFPELEAALARRYRLCRTLATPAMPSGYTPGRTRIYTLSLQ